MSHSSGSYLHICNNEGVAIEIKKCDDSNIQDLGKIWSLTYRSGSPYEVDQTRSHLSENYIAYLNGEPAGAYGISPMTATRGEATYQCAGVLAVAVMPHIRNSGVGGIMMRQALRDYYDKGYELAHLYGFRETWYRQFGYEVAGVRYRLSVEVPFFPKVRGDLPVRQFGIEGVERIKACYETFAHRRSGFNLRHNGQWERIFPTESNRTIYAAGDPVEAYIVLQHQANFWEEQEIIEFVWSTKRGYDAMLAVLAGIGKNKTKVTWFEPSDSPFRAFYWDRGASISLTNTLMYRVINVKKALEGLKPKVSGSFTIEVADEDLPENAGPWRVAFSPEKVTVEKTTDAGLKIDVRQFAQALLGEPSLAYLAMNELVEVRDQNDLTEAEKLLCPSPTLCFEAF